MAQTLMVVKICCDELYPFYEINTKHGNTYEIPLAKLEWVKRTMKEFHKVQTYLESLESIKN